MSLLGALAKFGSRASKTGAGAVRSLRTAGETVAGQASGAPGFGMALAGGAAFLGADVAIPAAAGILPVIRDEVPSLAEEIEFEKQAIIQRRSMEARAESLSQSIVENLARLAAVNPDLYHSIAAGRRLPRGAMSIGGRVRTDLLELMGRSMAEGAYQKPVPVTDPLAFLQS